MTTAWRFIPYSEHSGAYNMAADEAILNAHLAKLSPPTLRIYGFNPPAVSIGSNQYLPASTVRRLRSHGLDVVRRPSGGRAVVHVGDLTYSFIGTSAIEQSQLSSQNFLLPSVHGAYRQIGSALVAAFKQLGLQLDFGTDKQSVNRAVQDKTDCFAATLACDLKASGLKLIGSAQLRRQTAVLQHGTIILKQDPAIAALLLNIKKNNVSCSPIPRKHANLYDLLDDKPTIAQLESALLLGFQDIFDTCFVFGKISIAEKNEITAMLDRQICLSGAISREAY